MKKLLLLLFLPTFAFGQEKKAPSKFNFKLSATVYQTNGSASFLPSLALLYRIHDEKDRASIGVGVDVLKKYGKLDTGDFVPITPIYAELIGLRRRKRLIGTTYILRAGIINYSFTERNGNKSVESIGHSPYYAIGFGINFGIKKKDFFISGILQSYSEHVRETTLTTGYTQKNSGNNSFVSFSLGIIL